MEQRKDDDALWQRVQGLERQIQERDRELQKETDRALQQAEQIGSILQLFRERERRNEKRETALEQELDQALKQIEKKNQKLRRAKKRERQGKKRERALQKERDMALQRAQGRDRQAQDRDRLDHERDRKVEERERELQQERDSLLQQIKENERQAEERARALEQEKNAALRLAQERERTLHRERWDRDPTYEPSTLDGFIKECHASLYSKLVMDKKARQSRHVSSTNIRGKWHPEKLMQWTEFLSEQKVVFNNVREVFPTELRAFLRPITVRQYGTGIVSIADEKTLERFVNASIQKPVNTIMKELQSMDTGKLGRVCQIHFVIHPDDAKPLQIDAKTSRPGDPESVRARFCINLDRTTENASSSLLYVWEPKAPYDLTVEDLRAALRPTTTFGDLAAETGSPAVATEDAEEVSQFNATAEQRVNRAVTQTYHNMMENSLEFGILTTGQAIVFLHVNWDDPQTLYYHIAEPALDVSRAPWGDAAFFSAVGQYVAFTIMALNKYRKPLQQQRARVLKTLSKWGIPPTLSALEDGNAAPDSSGHREEECDAHSQNTKTDHQNAGGEQDSAPDRPYCSHKCLLGLVQGEYLDPDCPNVTLHCRGGACEAADSKRHPVDHAEWLRLLREQFKQSLDVGIKYEDVVDARGALFKVTLLAYGYTFFGKGTVSGRGEHVEHEARVYERLMPIQGQYVPVFLGTMDLRTVDQDKGYWIYFETYIVHMTFISWGGFQLDEDNLWEKYGPCCVEESEEALNAVHNEGVLHCDLRCEHILYSPKTDGIMIVDFEKAELLKQPELPDEHTRKGDGLGKNYEQLYNEAMHEKRAKVEKQEIIDIICNTFNLVIE
ncbi:hypothetical protein E4U13_007319 [Claviceps humidiphila]|uniref:Protein kinase domain-containing protein n=1 Tax=Claviceps humidiphila TaxID=1294629 RepID=A0A9P7PV05_9HYPO|nr:hypothetical protein E4U13_007319 [Claviceps humidiphila]